MAEYRIRETGEIILDLAAHFPNVSVPLVPSADDCDALGVDPVLNGPQPTATQFQVVYRDGVEEIDGKWYTKFSVADMDPEAIDALTASQWDSVRTDRNKRLADCDWTQLPDCPLDSPTRLEWISYRQALRDITEQADPFAIAWPQELE